MKVLVTSARLPHTLGIIRKLGRAGHEVYAADTFKTAPGLHSKFVAERIVTVEPASEPERYAKDIDELMESRKIDMLIPGFEEVFYLAKERPAMAGTDRYFFPPFETLAKLHNKETFQQVLLDLGLRTARTIVAKSSRELRDAVEQFDEYFARAAFSRGGVTLLTNTGPLAGAVAIEDCHPTEENPWLVQEFVHGDDRCSFTVAHHGQIAAHCTYQHPLTIEHAGGIAFQSVDEPEAFEISKRIIEHFDYHGHFSLDYLKTESGELHIVECNPRPTAGIFPMGVETYSDALFSPRTTPTIVPAGRDAQIDVAIVREMFRDPKTIPADVHQLLSGAKDVYSQKGDRLPGLYAVLSYSHVIAFRHRLHVSKHKHSDIMEAQFFDVAWDGGSLD